MLKDHVEETFKPLVSQIADEYSFKIAHMEIGKDDYVHLLVSASITNIVR